MKIIHVVGARPNFMKVAPVLAALSHRSAIQQRLVHTGQHYDYNMSEVFFQQLGIPRPDVNLEVGSGSHAQQTAEIMMRFDAVVLDSRPDLVLVYGDVNSTVAAALVCAKLCIPVGHVEAGLRSGDRTMPEEINRLVTDQLSDILFTPSADGDANLAREGIPAERIHMVGNVMIDTLVRCLPLQRAPEGVAVEGRFVLVTLHRPSNVDDPVQLKALIEALSAVAQEVPVLFPVHPRTRPLLGLSGRSLPAGLRILEPLGYLEFLYLQSRATAVVTDSGGIQEETTYLRVPCLTLRENTERPVTATTGSNLIIGRDTGRLKTELGRVLSGEGKRGELPPLWDGKAGERIARIIEARCAA